MTSMRRGFKTTAEKISIEIRDDLGLTPHDRLDPMALAAHLAIPVRPVTELAQHDARDECLECLLDAAARFSAITVFRGSMCCVFFNPRHSIRPRANSIAHELAHVVLEHEPGTAVTQEGLRNWNARQEDEADWQAGALLIPREGALRWMAHRSDLTGGADHFGVSYVELLNRHGWKTRIELASAIDDYRSRSRKRPAPRARVTSPRWSRSWLTQRRRARIPPRSSPFNAGSSPAASRASTCPPRA
jgi:hypothetical protein